MVKESTALGAAICAGVGGGLFSDPVETAQRIVAIERTYEPDAEAAERYTVLFDQWLDLYARVLPLADDAIVRPLWRAPGS